MVKLTAEEKKARQVELSAKWYAGNREAKLAYQNKVYPKLKHKPVVYFIQVGSYIKIGTTTAIKHRVVDLNTKPNKHPNLDEFKTNSPELLGTVKGSIATECELHDIFSEYRVGNSEWFTMSPALLLFIFNLNN